MIFNPVHPGEVLKDYLGGMTVTEAAARLRVTRGACPASSMDAQASKQECR